MKKKLTTLSEMARELKINKSRLSYYASQGIIKPEINLGGLGVYNRDKIIKAVKKLDEKYARKKTSARRGNDSGNAKK